MVLSELGHLTPLQQRFKHLAEVHTGTVPLCTRSPN